MLVWIGLVLVGISAWCAMAMNRTDAELQRYRLPGQPDSSYWFVPLRIRKALYQPAGAPLVRQAWRLIGAMYGIGMLGLLLLWLGLKK